jgi:hypothetical protein
MRAYGFGDGAFYTKHVRCRDPYALWLFLRQMGTMGGRTVVKTAMRRKPWERDYVRGVFSGIRGSFGWNVDRKQRLYTTPKAKQKAQVAKSG